MKKLLLRHLTLLMSLSLGSASAYAAAFQFYELGTPIIGTAGVGQASNTHDASTAYFNPAGMSSLPYSELMLGSQLIVPEINFSSHSNTTYTGNNGGNAALLTPGLGGYYVYNASSKLKLGVSLTMPYGGAESYNNHWVGRYNVQQMMFYTLNLNPSVSYQVNSWMSLGGGLSLEYANLYQTVALPIIPGLDGQATVKMDNFSPGFNVGAMFTPRPDTQVGVAFRSQIVHHLTGNIDFMNIGYSPGASTRMVMPANVIASMSQRLSKQFVLLGELGWSHWSSMRNNVIYVDGFTAVTPQNWQDTYRVGLGGRYQLNPALLFQAGISYDSSPTSSTKRLPDLPFDRQVRLGAGVEYEIVRAVNLGLSYEHINFGSANINNTSSAGVLAGDYSRNYANVLQASLNVGFG